MESSILSQCAALECLVVILQVSGVATLCLTRLFPQTRWASHGRVGFVVTVIGLGIAGALCGRHDSQFALFAGMTMTLLLIGMIMGGGAIHRTRSIRMINKAKTPLPA